jgi:hypothetical protein
MNNLIDGLIAGYGVKISLLYCNYFLCNHLLGSRPPQLNLKRFNKQLQIYKAHFTSSNIHSTNYYEKEVTL